MNLALTILVCGCAIGLLCTQNSLADSNTNARASQATAGAPSLRKVQVEEFEKLWKAKTNVVLDVRTKKEFEAGHIPGAKNIDVNQPDFEQKIAGLDKNKVYLVHCAAGVRSARACDKMTRLGFHHLIDLAPGFKAWEKAGKAVEK